MTETSTDAVNGSQLYAVANQVSSNTIRIEQNSAKIETVQAIATQYNNQQTAWNTEQDIQIANLKKLTEGFLARQDGFEKALHDQRREARAGVAGANALAIVPQAINQANHPLVWVSVVSNTRVLSQWACPTSLIAVVG